MKQCSSNIFLGGLGIMHGQYKCPLSSSVPWKKNDCFSFIKDLMKNNDSQRQQNGFTIYDEMSCQGIDVYTQTSSNFQPPPPPYLVVVNREQDGGWN
jgi:hypothetical protein